MDGVEMSDGDPMEARLESDGPPELDLEAREDRGTREGERKASDGPPKIDGERELEARDGRARLERLATAEGVSRDGRVIRLLEVLDCLEEVALDGVASRPRAGSSLVSPDGDRTRLETGDRPELRDGDRIGETTPPMFGRARDPTVNPKEDRIMASDCCDGDRKWSRIRGSSSERALTARPPASSAAGVEPIPNRDGLNQPMPFASIGFSSARSGPFGPRIASVNRDQKGPRGCSAGPGARVRSGHCSRTRVVSGRVRPASR